MPKRSAFKSLAGAVVLAAATGSVVAAGAAPLRVCADPDNLPFTKAEGPERGLYIELAELVAARLGAPVEYTWYYTNNQRRALRNTVLAKNCDAVFALPSDYKARGVQKSQAFLKVGYAVVAAPGFRFSALDDLKGQRVAVLFSSTPHILLSSLDGFKTTTYRDTDEAYSALARGDVDAAFLWGPSAGYDNQRRHAERWRVTPVSGLDLAGEMSVGVRADMEPLRSAIDQALLELRPQIAVLADKYGFPRQAALELALPPAALALALALT